MKKTKNLGVFGVLAVSLFGCSRQSNAPVAASNRVVLYCSVDDVYARPIIRDLEKQTGLKIDVLYDTEAAKTAGLANRIRAEKSRPQGDVFWSSALLQTLLLNREGLLQPYISPSAKDVPKAFKAKDGSWTGLGVRARVVVSNRFVKTQVQPDLWTLLSGGLENKVGISNPQFGTGSDWVATLAVRWGQTRALDYFRALKKNGVHILPGNSVVAEKIARYELLAGVTDTDDYFAQKSNAVSRYELWEGKAVFIPGSVAILKNAPHTENAQKLVDALLHIETEKQLVNTMIGVIPTRPQIKITQPELKILAARMKNAPDDTAKWAGAWDEIREPLAEILLKD